MSTTITVKRTPHPYPLQQGIVYGPIRSRRLGTSLGINPLPSSYKLCSSNCVYCQYGWTYNEAEDGATERIPTAEEVLAAAEEAMGKTNLGIDFITLAGNGEPTLHPQLKEIVVGLKMLRDRWMPHAKVGILSDSTTVHRPKVREALIALDEKYMKLDAGDEAMFLAVNKPMGKVDWQQMIDGLKALPEVTLQSLLIMGAVDNTQPDHIDRWIETVAFIKPKAVQIYPIDRPPADSGITKVPLARLKEIGELLTKRTGIPALVFG